MTVLVTGGAGYIGGHTVHQLVDQGEKVVVLDDLSTGQRSQVPSGVPLIAGDAGNVDLVHRIIRDHKVESVMHFAGSIQVEESVLDPLKYYRNNVDVSRTVLEAAVAGGVKHFVFSSSAAVYGNPVQVPVPESAPEQPTSPYGWSKVMTEVMLRDATEAHGLRNIILRYFNVAGADPDGHVGYRIDEQPSHLIRRAVQTALGMHEYLEVFGTDYPTPDGTAVRDYIHVSDIANAHLHALRYLRNGGEPQTLNCGYGKGYSVLEVVEATKRVSGADFTAKLMSRRRGDVGSVTADVHLIGQVLPNWKPKFKDLNTIVRHQLNWEKARQKDPAAY